MYGAGLFIASIDRLRYQDGPYLQVIWIYQHVTSQWQLCMENLKIGAFKVLYGATGGATGGLKACELSSTQLWSRHTLQQDDMGLDNRSTIASDGQRPNANLPSVPIPLTL